MKKSYSTLIFLKKWCKFNLGLRRKLLKTFEARFTVGVAVVGFFAPILVQYVIHLFVGPDIDTGAPNFKS